MRGKKGVMMEGRGKCERRWREKENMLSFERRTVRESEGRKENKKSE